jgi:hypothetical protein
MQRHHLERVLFVVGNRHCGKSTQLRSMFKDVRLSTAGSIPKDRKLADFHRLTNDRFLYLRLSSPHAEAGVRAWNKKGSLPCTDLTRCRISLPRGICLREKIVSQACTVSPWANITKISDSPSWVTVATSSCEEGNLSRRTRYTQHSVASTVTLITYCA